MPFVATRAEETLAKSGVLKVAESGVAVSAAVTIGRVSELKNAFKTIKDKVDQDQYAKPIIRHNKIQGTILDIDDGFEQEVLQKLDGHKDCTWIIEYPVLNKATHLMTTKRMVIPNGGFAIGDGEEPFDGTNAQGLPFTIDFSCHPSKYPDYKEDIV